MSLTMTPNYSVGHNSKPCHITLAHHSSPIAPIHKNTHLPSLPSALPLSTLEAQVPVVDVDHVAQLVRDQGAGAGGELLQVVRHVFPGIGDGVKCEMRMG